jgi:hypothetical protein
MTAPHRLARDEALLWLNDRLGESVHVSVNAEKGDLEVTVLEAEGSLRHWREASPAGAAWEGLPRDDLIGSYEVEGAHFDLSDLEHLPVWERESIGPELEIELAENVYLRIIEQQELPGA